MDGAWVLIALKIYVEIERARLTRILSKMKEDEGNISEAAKVLQELQVYILAFLKAPRALIYW